VGHDGSVRLIPESSVQQLISQISKAEDKKVIDRENRAINAELRENQRDFESSFQTSDYCCC
jgi:hypothetical protein